MKRFSFAKKYRKVAAVLYKRWEFISNLNGELSNCKSVLDLGCGFNSPLQYFNLKYSVGVDIYKSCIDRSREKGYHSTYINADITKIEFNNSSFDAVYNAPQN